jgi:hypothetical protein
MATEWLANGSRDSDLSKDGHVDLKDFVILANDWLKCNLSPLPECIPPRDGDISGDSQVDYSDLRMMAVEWLNSGDLESNLDGQGNINFQDFAILANNWLKRNLMPLLFKADFEDSNLDAWQATDPTAWQIENGHGGKVLSLFKQSSYAPPFRSPYNINLIQNVNVGSFVLEVKMLSTKAYYNKRDLCLIFGYQDPSHFYYAHLADVAADAFHNSILIVNGADRASIVLTRNGGNSWEGGWHTVRLVRDIYRGTIKVFFDDMTVPVMTAVDHNFNWGKVGVGSFDDTGQFDDIQLWGQEM